MLKLRIKHATRWTMLKLRVKHATRWTIHLEDSVAATGRRPVRPHGLKPILRNCAMDSAKLFPGNDVWNNISHWTPAPCLRGDMLSQGWQILMHNWYYSLLWCGCKGNNWESCGWWVVRKREEKRWTSNIQHSTPNVELKKYWISKDGTRGMDEHGQTWTDMDNGKIDESGNQNEESDKSAPGVG